MDRFKAGFSVLLLIVTVGWAAFTVFIVRDAQSSPTQASVLEASGSVN